MADAKISALTALGAAPAVGDRIPIVDVSDTTQAASGTTKYVTVAQAFTNPAFTGTPTATTGYQVTATLGQGYGFVGDDNTLWGYRQADTLSAYAGAEKVRIDATQMSLFTANFAFTPNPGDGGSDIWSYQYEEKTLATGSTTSTTTADLAAANSVIRAILVRVQTTITTAANFNVRVTGGNPFEQDLGNGHGSR